MARNKYLIIDGNNLLHRAYHRFKNMSSKEGVNSSITFGFPYILRSLIQVHKPDDVLVVFDKGSDKNRLKILPDYRKRPKKGDFDYENFLKQKEDTQKILSFLGVPFIQPEEGEADDIIWLYARRYKRKGHNVVIVSTDKDFVQIICKGISIHNPWKNVRISHKNVTQHYPFSPANCVDYLILEGDKSDNILGFPGVGEKTAVKFLEEYGSIKKYLLSDTPEDKKITRSKLEPIYLRNRLLIDIRLFCRRFINPNDIPKPVKGREINKRELSMICSYYSITTFTKEDFLKTFKKLL